MAAPAPRHDEVAVVDQLIVRSLAMLRMARAAYARSATPRNREVLEHAEENLDSLLDVRSARQHRSPVSRPRSDEERRVTA
jgi:hypothetical protein